MYARLIGWTTATITTTMAVVQGQHDTNTLCASVDFGQNANAMVIGRPYRRPIQVLAMYVEALGTISSAKDAVDAMGGVLRRIPPGVQTFLLEEQCLQNKATPMLEAALSAFAVARGPRALVVHVPVTRVKNAFSLPAGYNEKKKAAASLVDKLLAGSAPKSIEFDPAVKTAMLKLKRRHDVADALLQLIWFSRIGRHEPTMMTSGRVVRATDPKQLKAEHARTIRKQKQRMMAMSKLYHKPGVIARRPPAAKRRRKVSTATIARPITTYFSHS
jgi:hypothetical protein